MKLLNVFECVYIYIYIRCVTYVFVYMYIQYINYIYIYYDFVKLFLKDTHRFSQEFVPGVLDLSKLA